MEEGGGRDGGDGDTLDQVPREGDVVVEAEGADAGHHVVGAVRGADVEAGGGQAADHDVAALGVLLEEAVEEGGRRRDRLRHGDLQRVGGAHGEEVVHFADARRQLRRRDQPAHAPAGHAEGLGSAADGDRALLHSGQRRDRNVPAGVDEMLVDLVRQADGVVLFAEVGDQLQLFLRVDLAGRVVRRVDDDRPGALCEGSAQLVRIERPVGGPQGHIAGNGAAQDAVRAIVLIEGLEDDDLVARVEDREHRRDHRFGGATGDCDLPVGIDRAAPGLAVLRRERASQLRRSPGGGVLVEAAGERSLGGFDDLWGRFEVGEALREVDSAVAIQSQVEPRHLPDDGFCEALGFVTEARHCAVRSRAASAPGATWCHRSGRSAVAVRGRARCCRRFRRPSECGRRSRVRRSG